MSPSIEWRDGAPYSTRFGDIYFSAADGLAESRAVFLAGCGLPQSWAERTRFVVGELGFGTGLNVLALLDLWRRSRLPGARLSVFSVEAFPLEREEAASALAAFPEVRDFAAALLGQWPDRRCGFRRLDFPDAGAILDLWIGEAAEGLRAWRGAASAWFLDGFAPSANPEMWRREVLQLVSERSEPGARLASFTVAGAVRRGLENVGFSVERRPGFAHKRQRLEARLPGQALQIKPPDRVAIVGAGIAGASLARALRRLGCEPTLVDRGGLGGGASGNPSALVTPRLDAGFGGAAMLHAAAFARAIDLYRAETPEAIVATGALQLERTDRDADRFDRIQRWAGFAPGALERLSPADAARRLAEPQACGGLRFRDGLVVEPALILRTWTDGVPTTPGVVASLDRHGDLWRLYDESGEMIVEAEAVCLAAGPACASLADLPLHPVRGQASWTDGAPFQGEPAAWGGYAIPLPSGGVLFGATHDRNDRDVEPRDRDTDRNLAALAERRPDLAASLRRASATLENRAALRAATADHLPLAGVLYPGLAVLTGLGGRGFTLAPLLAEHVAALLTGAPSPLPAEVVEAVDPARFSRRSV